MRLTLREREIMELLKKDPLISQDELARHLGISRSSIAVHISNLMKKGVILGKGYVFNDQASIVVIGLSYLQINLDKQGEQNVIDLNYRGLPIVAGEILAGFGVNLKIISLIGNDEPGTMIINLLLNNKVDTTYISRHLRKRTCRRLSIDDSSRWEEGFDLQDYKQVLNSREWIIFNSEWLIVDPYFQDDVLERANKKDEEDLPHFCTYSYLGENRAIPEHLTRFNTLILGVGGSAGMEYYRKQLYSMGELVQNCIITDGRSGLIYRSGEMIGDYPLPPNQGFDSQDGLPGLLTGVVYGLSSGYPLRQAIRMGAGFASSSEFK